MHDPVSVCDPGIESALQGHLQKRELNGIQDNITSSHPEYEKLCKAFIDQHFPNRFSSYREFYAALTFKRRLCEHHLWEGAHGFIAWANNHCDFQKAAQLDSGSIYRVCSLVARKLLVYANPDSREDDGFNWGHITMSALKCCIPTAEMTYPSCPSLPWSQPYIFQKSTDCEKLDCLLAPMQDSKASKAPAGKEDALGGFGREPCPCPGPGPVFHFVILYHQIRSEES